MHTFHAEEKFHLIQESSRVNQKDVKILQKKKVIDNKNFISASSSGASTAVKELLPRHKAGPTLPSTDGFTDLMRAAQTGRLELAKLLLQQNADPTISTVHGCTAFILAAQYGHTEVVKLLLEYAIDPNFPAKNGYTALMLASQNGHKKVVELLLKEHHTNPNAINAYNETALIIAVKNKHIEIIALLLDNGAEDIANTKGISALSFADRMGNDTIINMLQTRSSFSSF